MALLTLPSGSVLGGYEIVSLLGRGGMGAVYRARKGETEIALKTVSAEVSDEEVARFRREGELLASLRHPSIVRVHSAGESQGLLYFAMDLVEGESLDARIRREGPLPPDEAVAVTLDVAEAIAYAHSRKVLHRDLKPANVLLRNEDDDEGRALVTDFGLARRRGIDQDRLTVTGEIMGTPSFMAPEQAFGRTSEIDERTDVYGLGAILYAALSGREPFKTGSPFETMKLVRESDPDGLPDAPGPLEAFVFRALSKNREDRPSSAKEFARELEEAFFAKPPFSRTLKLGVLFTTALACLAITSALLVARALKLGKTATAKLTPLDLAREAHDRHDLEAALQLAEKTAEAKDPSAAEVFAISGDIAFETSSWSLAESSYKKALAQDRPNNASLPIALWDNARFASSLASIASSTPTGPLSKGLLTDLAQRLEHHRDRPEAAPLVFVRSLLYRRALKSRDAPALAQLEERKVTVPPDLEAELAATWFEIACQEALPLTPSPETFNRYKDGLALEARAEEVFGSATRTLDALTRARIHGACDRGAPIRTFPPSLRGFFIAIRILSGYNPRLYEDRWRKAFESYTAKFGEHPTLLLIRAHARLQPHLNGNVVVDYKGALEEVTPFLHDSVIAALDAVHDERGIEGVAYDLVIDILRPIINETVAENHKHLYAARDPLLEIVRVLDSLAKSRNVHAIVVALEKVVSAPGPVPADVASEWVKASFDIETKETRLFRELSQED